MTNTISDRISICLDETKVWPDSDLVRVNFNGRMFEVMGLKHQHILASVVTAALLCCLDVVPKEEDTRELPF